jgi:hypothetical protein
MWVSNLRAKKDKLEDSRRRQLDDLGFIWDALHAAWERGFDALTLYKARMGHCRVPDNCSENGFALGAWIGVQRRKRETLSDDRRRRLDEIGFIWDAFSIIWEGGFDHLKSYNEREGHCRVPRGYKENGFPLGTWVSHQRAGKDTLSEQRRARLNELGFDWNPHETTWERGFDALALYKERTGHCRIPDDYSENGFALGTWVGIQRRKRETLSEERKRRLDKLRFV